jgi:threonine synthase
MALKDIRSSGGCGVLVSEEAILDAIPRLAAATAVFAEPAAAIALAGLEIALAEGLVSRGERVVLLVTGTGLKDVPAAARRVRVPNPVAPTLEAVETFLAR